MMHCRYYPQTLSLRFMKASVLIADDDTVLSQMLAEYLSAEGYETSLAEDGAKALEVLNSAPIDLVVLDIMMPNLDGIETLRQIRASFQLPVIMLTARGDDLDRILGLELGADDYVSKPCNPRELLARIKAVLRRTNQKPDDTAPVSVGEVLLDPRSREVRVKGILVALTQTEFDLLHLLLRTPGEVVSKNTISMEVLGKPLSQWDRSIDVHISNLRKKIGSGADNTDNRIRTLRGAGYMYIAPGSSSNQNRL